MTLYERMKPSLREKLDEIKPEYPSTHEQLVKALSETDFFTDLKYGDVIALEDHVGKPIYHIFNPNS